MALCAEVTRQGFVTATSKTLEDCGGYVLVTPAEHEQLAWTHELFAPHWPTAEWTFGSVLAMWAMGIALGLILNLLRKAR
ncbi:hypothetical protein [Arhodomonas sp. AD133]|uniref:hypothetical protein n=1 Tax=Arhodomonas sp. AD133 TaxID=3415009 RepID=UPI003EB723D6